MEAIVLGGAPNSGPIRAIDDTPYEAGIKINDRPMIEYILDVLEAMDEIETIAVVIPEGIIEPGKWTKIKPLPPGVTVIDSLLQAVTALQPKEHVLVLASDIPLITKEALRDFLASCSRRQAAIYYSFVPKPVVEEKYPGVKRTYVQLKDAIVTGGNVLLIEPQAIITHHQRLRQAFALRKHPVKLCQLLGFRFLFKLLCGQLEVGEIEARVEEILNLKGAGIVSLYPEIGVDVDKPSDLELVRSILAAN